jgi:hypothetical protein
MLQGAGGPQQTARGLRQDTSDARERLTRRFLLFTNEFPVVRVRRSWMSGTLSLTAEKHLAPSTIRATATLMWMPSSRASSAAGPFGGEVEQGGRAGLAWLQSECAGGARRAGRR